jgi:hypothetical protein
MSATQKQPQVWLTINAIADAVDGDRRDIANRVLGWEKRVSHVPGAHFEFLCPPGWNKMLREDLAKIKRRPGARGVTPKSRPDKVVTAVKAEDVVEEYISRERQEIEDAVSREVESIKRLSMARRYDPETIPKDGQGNVVFSLLTEVMIQRMMANKQHFHYVIAALSNFPAADRNRIFDEISREATRRNKEIFGQNSAYYTPLKRVG